MKKRNLFLITFLMILLFGIVLIISMGSTPNVNGHSADNIFITMSKEPSLIVSYTMSANTNSYVYEDISSVSDYNIQSGDYVEYDVYWTSANDFIAFDYQTSDKITLRDSGTVDQNGKSAHPGTDLSSYALNKWYHRKIQIPAGHVGKIIAMFMIACENDNSAIKTAYLQNISITNGAGTIRKKIYSAGDQISYSVAYANNGYINKFISGALNGYKMTLQYAIDNNYFKYKANIQTQPNLPNIINGHSADDINVLVNNNQMTLQDALNSFSKNPGFFCSGGTSTLSINFGHDSGEVLVSINGNTKTLQSAINDNNLCIASSIKWVSFGRGYGSYASDGSWQSGIDGKGGCPSRYTCVPGSYVLYGTKYCQFNTNCPCYYANRDCSQPCNIGATCESCDAWNPEIGIYKHDIHRYTCMQVYT